MADIVQRLASNISAQHLSGLAASPSKHLSALSWLWSYYLLPAVVAYPLLCSALRFRRLKNIQAKYNYGSSTNPSYEGMTVVEAHKIIDSMSCFEFPALFTKGLQFALFRTYGIPTISSLLFKTTQLSAEKNVPKRYADTTILLFDIMSAEPNSERANNAFARLNYLHGHYIRQGKISNDDMLYTLALFMNQPVEWVNRFEWRQFTDLEICAMGVFHKYMGESMQINFDVLPSAKSGWKDGLHFYRELNTWFKDYEKEYMVPDVTNYEVAVKTRDLLICNAPTFAHSVLQKMVSAPLDDRLREAIMFDKAPPAYTASLNGFMTLRRVLLRYLALPRPWFMEDTIMTEKPDKAGRRYIVTWDTKPVYVKPTLWNRWGPGALMSRVLGIAVPGDAGTHPEGFVVDDVGPSVFVGKGRAEARETVKHLETKANIGCPFAMQKR
ncbi:hypothetical protein PV10_08038 [Exophiala mesophila]|uniref:Uncharacterized protein n=1 Tax=Exophiala mesophila TaxID=212818 RepID=A0A0D1Z0J6_EXOME|nr:uncharacterized protein PV10_08038 [Exophiala mesophila]KIV88347.1 hypothetical protein PV10_08038 [Exophiala mesophila]